MYEVQCSGYYAWLLVWDRVPKELLSGSGNRIPDYPGVTRCMLRLVGERLLLRMASVRAQAGHVLRGGASFSFFGLLTHVALCMLVPDLQKLALS